VVEFWIANTNHNFSFQNTNTFHSVQNHARWNEVAEVALAPGFWYSIFSYLPFSRKVLFSYFRVGNMKFHHYCPSHLRNPLLSSYW